MNILVTTRCNHDCEYCFVKQYPPMDMGMDQVRYLTSFHDFASLQKISILGGEPTLHPYLPEIVNAIQNSNPNVAIQLFSHCGNAAERIDAVDSSNIVLVANCYDDRDNPKVADNLRIAREKGWTIVLSYTITSKILDAEGVINFCRKHNIRIVRWSLSMPAYSVNNNFVPIQSYAEYLREVKLFCSILLKNRIATYNDCPIPPCHSDNLNRNPSMRQSVYVSGIRYGKCLPPYDIYPGNTVTGCMGIGNRIQFDLKSVKSIEELNRKYYEHVATMYRPQKDDFCTSCGKCSGGCFGFV